MSVSSLFNSLGASTAYGYGTTKSTDGVSSTTQAILDAVGKATASTSGSGGVTISTDAKLAAANATDNAKDFSVLTVDVRKALDDKSTGLDEMSGRALAAIMLNRNGDFTRSEVAAAKAELNGRNREDFTALIGGSATLGGLAAYNQQLVSQYDAMSDEEREARGWTEQVRSSAAAFVTGTENMTSLFDQLDADD